MRTGTTDLQDAASPEDVATVLRNAAQKYREAPGDLAAAWQDPQAGKVWGKIADSLQAEARKIERLIQRSA